MAESVLELIAVDILAKIAAITTDNGFHQTLTPIRTSRIEYEDQTPDNNTVLIIQEEEDYWDEEPNTTKAWEQPFSLQVVVLEADGVTTAIDTKRNRVRADIHKKLMEDPKRGGNANDTIIRPSTFFNNGKGFCGIEVHLLVRYRTKINDPYTRVA